MNLNSKLIFIVGPGGAGKSTNGKLLAEKLGVTFIDVDQEFNKRILLIPDYVKKHGYKAYCERNSELVEELLAEKNTESVFSFPSGFLVHEDSPELVKKHKNLLNENGVSILLMPSESLVETQEIIVRRQLSRGFPDMDEDRERAVIVRRHPLYKQYGDIKIFSYEDPDVITNKMIEELKKLGLTISAAS